jgi:hypothetical protein
MTIAMTVIELMKTVMLINISCKKEREREREREREEARISELPDHHYQVKTRRH